MADKIGNDDLNIIKDENLNRLLDSFDHNRPKGTKRYPQLEPVLVLHRLAKPPFEPLRKASLKH